VPALPHIPQRLTPWLGPHIPQRLTPWLGPLGKKLDPYQWLLFIAAHSERHTKQMLEVKADPGFPKS
jgi:hypothetical protein